MCWVVLAFLLVINAQMISYTHFVAQHLTAQSQQHIGIECVSSQIDSYTLE